MGHRFVQARLMAAITLVDAWLHFGIESMGHAKPPLN
jgi:hypothetical protein